MWTCTECAVTKDKPAARLPRGWKRSNDGVYCPNCWNKRAVLRAIALPIVSPIDGTWEELRSVMKEMWAATTQASNWMMTQLYARDVKRNGEAKMPAMPKAYLYPETRQRFPQLPPQTAASLEQATQAKYRAKRYEVVWTCKSSLPTFRYPTPFPLPNQAWSVSIEGETPVVSVRIGDRRWSLRLKGGPRYHRQRAAVESLASGSATKGELALYEQGKDIMCKMVAWLPREPARKLDKRPLYVRTSYDNEGKLAMIVALNEKDDKLWIWNGDHIKRWSEEHRKQLQRWADDTKAEQRPVPAFADRRSAAAVKYRDRMSSAVREIAAMIAGYAQRRKFSSVRYDDSDISFCEGFPWYNLRERLRTKLDELGIEMDHASGEVVADKS